MTIDELAQMVTDIRNSQDRIENDLTSDRGRLDNIENRLKSVEGKQDTLNERMPRTDIKMKDAMAEVAQPMIEATDKLTAEIKKKTIITRIIRPNLFQTLFRRGVKSK